MRPLRLLCFFLSATVPLTAVVATAADKPSLRFAEIFTDDMVLQQQKPIRVWGWAEPGATVTVTLTQDPAVGRPAMDKALELERARGVRQPGPQKDDGSYSVTVQYVEKNPPKLPTRSVEAKAAADGRWSIEFEPAAASFQSTWVLAASGDEAIGVQNVLIGEIWVCAGQSNMVWSNFNRKGREAASADFPGLRYVAWNDSWYKPLDDVRNGIHWSACSPENAQRDSAVPYLYGMFLHRYLKVPVGIINVARGGTLGQTWCLREELDGIDNEIVKTVLADYDAETATWEDPDKVARIMADWEKVCEEAKAEHEKQVAQAKCGSERRPGRFPAKTCISRRDVTSWWASLLTPALPMIGGANRNSCKAGLPLVVPG